MRVEERGEELKERGRKIVIKLHDCRWVGLTEQLTVRVLENTETTWLNSVEDLDLSLSEDLRP